MSIPNATTQLQAVNIILATIGEAPLDSLSGATTGDAQMAATTLDEVNKECQVQGWYFNTDKNYPLTRDVNMNIWLPANTARLQIDRARYSNIEPIMRPMPNGLNQLYDRLNRTYVFNVDLVAQRIVWFQDWTQLPESFRRYCVIRAARIFADRSVGAETMHQFTAADEANSLRILKADFADTDQLNILSSPSTQDMLFRGGGIWRF